MNITNTLVQGDSATWRDAACTINGVSYTAPTYTLTYRIRGPVVLDLVAATQGQGWLTTLSATQSATLTAGTYWWSAQLSTTTERITIGSGQLIVTPDLAAASANYDGRTQAEKDLAAVDAAITTRAQNGVVLEYAIGTRNIKRENMAGLLQLRALLQLRVRNEQAQKSIANGNGNPNTLYARFTR